MGEVGNEEAERSHLLGAIWDRVARAQAGDPSGVLGDDMVSEASRLAALPGSEEHELSETLEALAWFSLCRFAALPAGEAVNILYQAISLTSELAEIKAGGVPEKLRNTVEGARAENLAALASYHAHVVFAVFLRTRDGIVREEAIEMFRFLEEIENDPVARSNGRLGLASLLIDRARDLGAIADADEAIEICGNEIDSAPDEIDRVEIRILLSSGLQDRFERGGDIGDLHLSVDVARDAAAGLPASHALHASSRSLLCNALRLRFDRFGHLEDVEEAISRGREAVDALQPESREHTQVISNLSNALHARFLRVGRVEDLDEAVKLDRAALEGLPAEHRDRPRYHSNLGLALKSLYMLRGDPRYLDEAVAQCREAVEHTSEESAVNPRHQSNLALVAQTRFEHVGDLSDLDASIVAGRRAVEATAPEDPSLLPRLMSLGGSLDIQFEQTGGLADLEEAISTSNAALGLCPEDHPMRAECSSSLGVRRLARFFKAGEVDDLEGAVDACRDAVRSAPMDHANRSAFLSNLGTVMTARFEHFKASADLEEGIEALRQAAEACPADHVHRSRYLANLAWGFGVRYELGGDRADLGLAAASFEEAALAIPAEHPARALRLLNLGVAQYSRFEHDRDPATLEAAIDAFAKATRHSSGRPRARIQAASSWGHAAMQAGRVDDAADAFEAGVRLLPLLAWHGLPSATREQHLAEFTGLAANAAACAVQAGDTRRAVELLEAGRSVAWTQMLDLRTDLTKLVREAPELAGELGDVRTGLNAPLPEDLFDLNADLGASTPTLRASQTRLAAQRMRMARRFDELIGEIRGLEGFEYFLSPAPLSDLLDGAEDGPVVIVNASPFGCHAFILTRSGVEAIELPELTHRSAVEQRDALLEIIGRARLRAGVGTPVEQDEDRQGFLGILGWLWDAAVGPILAKLDSLDVLDTTEPRVWWCPTGPLSVLPLHAAGRYGPDRADGEDSALDRVISSYTTTMAALERARSQPHPERQSLLAVGMTTTPDRKDLPSVAAELDAIEARVGIDTRLQTSGIERARGQSPEFDPPTADRVLRELARHSCVHLACHGTQDVVRPAASAFWLADGPLTIRDLTEKLDSSSPRELAVLSACDTAAGSVAVPDEAMHLAAAMHHVGYRHVIAALWPIFDAQAATVAEMTYATLAPEGRVESGRAASAIHSAVIAARDAAPSDPLTWAPYVHVGA